MRTHGSRASEKITYKNLNYSGTSNDALLKKPAFWRGLQLVFLFFQLSEGVPGVFYICEA